MNFFQVHCKYRAYLSYVANNYSYFEVWFNWYILKYWDVFAAFAEHVSSLIFPFFFFFSSFLSFLSLINLLNTMTLYIKDRELNFKSCQSFLINYLE